MKKVISIGIRIECVVLSGLNYYEKVLLEHSPKSAVNEGLVT